MNDFLEQRIKAKEGALTKLSRQIRDLQKTRAETEAEIRAYRDVLQHVSGGGSEFPPVDDEVDVKAASSRISDTWREILVEVAKAYPAALSIDDFRDIIRKLGRDVSDLTLRSQLSLYKQRKWLNNVGTGLYKITEKGAEAVSYPVLIFEEDEDVNSLVG
ncbi:hypothetical protein [Methylobacterium sp. 37f]|uniref:hypothetical protein n=1 Tax=Methylobacterium sp. 37f TaxID=2817058 RepID=UPI001FFC3817|nr:hypothetical protein [Methylobacterium sp. 37f]MCK2057121.1 hypothetical protein [Methylobacterium sp. 37f]